MLCAALGAFTCAQKNNATKKICERGPDASSRAEADVTRQVSLVLYWLVVPTESRSWYNLIR